MVKYSLVSIYVIQQPWQGHVKGQFQGHIGQIPWVRIFIHYS